MRRYVAGLVTALLGLDDSPDIVALGGNPLVLPPGVSHVAASAHPPTNAGWILAGLPRTARTAGVDLIHAPAYTAPLLAPVPVVLTIHDVSYQRHPEWYPYRRDWLRRAFYRSSARAAHRVLTVSEFSAREIVAAYAIPPERIAVVPLGVDAYFGEPADDSSGAPVDEPYLLHVGDVHERRNLGVVIEAIAAIRRAPGAPGLSLVMAGHDRGSVPGLKDLAARVGVADTIAHVGVVTEARLRALYQHAVALVYPSRYEGFGLPVLEAMASGTPVIASRAASIPEVLGDAGVLLDPDDVAAWAGAIVSVATEAARRSAMREAGLRRAAGFTWTRTAEQTRAVYRQVLQR